MRVSPGLSVQQDFSGLFPGTNRAGWTPDPNEKIVLLNWKFDRVAIDENGIQNMCTCLHLWENQMYAKKKNMSENDFNDRIASNISNRLSHARTNNWRSHSAQYETKPNPKLALIIIRWIKYICIKAFIADHMYSFMVLLSIHPYLFFNSISFMTVSYMLIFHSYVAHSW